MTHQLDRPIVVARPRVDADVRTASSSWREAVPTASETIKRALQAASEAMNQGGDLAVLLTDDAEMRSLNLRWRGLDKSTDVLSFPASIDDSDSALEGAFLGDIAIGFGVSTVDAQRLNRSIEAHLSHLAVHGFLHLLGYDHVADSDAEAMEAAERQILASLGYPDPYLAADEDMDERNAG